MAEARVPRRGGAYALAASWGWTLAIAAMALLGGNDLHQRSFDLPAQALAALLVAVTIASKESRFARLGGVDWLVAALLGLFALQLLPLPPQIWTALPGRELAAEVDTAVFGGPLWRPLTLDPDATLRSLAFLLPAMSAWFALRTGTEQRQAALLRGIALAVLATLALAALQAASGQAEWSYLFAEAQTEFLTGLFANHNHHGELLLMAVPLLVLWLGVEQVRQGPGRIVLVGFGLVAALAVLASASRTASLLLVLALGGTALALMPERFRSLGRIAALAAAGAVGLAALVAAIFLLGGDRIGAITERTPLLADLRFGFWPDALHAAAAYFPVGSGFGSFARAYALNEPLESVSIFVVRHAHNDYLETAFEGGIAGLLLVATFLAWFARAALGAWLGAGTAPSARLAAVAAALPLAHSLVDFPLRTSAVAIAFALACAILERK